MNQTILKYQVGKTTRVVTLPEIYSLARLMAWINKRSGDPYNFRFTRKYDTGAQTSFRVVNAELISDQEDRTLTSNVLCNG